VNVRRLTFATCGFAAFLCLCSVSAASAQPSLARYLDDDSDRVELRNGRGLAALTARGGIHGTLGRGTLRIVDLKRGAETQINVYGAEDVKRVNDRVTVYRGRGLDFYVLQGWWKVRIQGRDIDAGAVVHGRLSLRGSAGTYLLRDQSEEDWPTRLRVFQLG
jgi:hypothetical protein